MSTEQLRKAAALIRERAEKATPGPWYTDGNYGLAAESVPDGLAISERGMRFIHDAEHIASWHPAVALAVADWLDTAAREFDIWGEDDRDITAPLAVARTYLGEPS